MPTSAFGDDGAAPKETDAIISVKSESTLASNDGRPKEADPTDSRKGTASMASTLLNLVKSIIGAGILGIPLALQRLGLVAGLLVMLVAAVLSAAGLCLLAVVVHAHGRASSFASVARAFYPRTRAVPLLLDFAIVIKCLGVGMSYLSVIGDVVPDVIVGIFGSQVLLKHRWLGKKALWVGATTAMLSPLVAMRRIDSLRYTSLFGLAGVVYLLGLSVFQAIVVGKTIGLGPLRLFAPLSVPALTSFAVFVFAFTCQQNLFPIQNEARANAPGPMARVSALAVSTSFCAYAAFGTLSAMANPGLRDKILSAYPQDQWPYVVARVFYALLLAFSFPLQTFPTRLSMLSAVQAVVSADWFERRRVQCYWAATVLILVISGAVAALPVSLDTFLTVVGSTSGPVICYFLPALLYIKQANANEAASAGGGRARVLLAVAHVLLVASVVIFVASSALAILKIATINNGGAKPSK